MDPKTYPIYNTARGAEETPRMITTLRTDFKYVAKGSPSKAPGDSEIIKNQIKREFKRFWNTYRDKKRSINRHTKDFAQMKESIQDSINRTQENLFAIDQARAKNNKIRLEQVAKDEELEQLKQGTAMKQLEDQRVASEAKLQQIELDINKHENDNNLLISQQNSYCQKIQAAQDEIALNATKTENRNQQIAEEEAQIASTIEHYRTEIIPAAEDAWLQATLAKQQVWDLEEKVRKYRQRKEQILNR